MNQILKHIARTQHRFTPKSPSDFFALQLARALSDIEAISKYLGVMYNQSEPLLSAAYRRLLKRGIPAMPLPHYQAELANGAFQGPYKLPDVLGIRIERRVMGLVLFGRSGIGRVETRELSWQDDAALKTAEVFMGQALSWCGQSTIALEKQDTRIDGRRKRLFEVIQRVIRESGLPIWEVDKTTMAQTFAQPPPRSMQEVRAITSGIFPTLSGGAPRTNTLLDAASLALHVHVARQLTPDIAF